MVTRQALEKKLAKYKAEIKKLAQEESADRASLRTFHKRLKRTQRKLVSVLHNEERLAKATGKPAAQAGETKTPEAQA